MSKKSSKKPSPSKFDYDTDDSGTTIARRGQRYFNEEMERHNKSLYVMLAAALYVLNCMVDLTEWAEFCEEEYWSRRIQRNRPKEHATDREKATFVAVYMFAGKDEVRYDRAWKYRRVIEFCLREEVKPEDMVSFLNDKGGIEKLIAEMNEGEKSLVIETEVLPSLAKLTGRDEAIDQQEDQAEPAEDGLSNDDDEKPRKSKAAKRELTLSVGIDQSKFDRTMECPINWSMWIKIVHSSDRGKFKVFRAEKVKSPKK